MKLRLTWIGFVLLASVLATGCVGRNASKVFGTVAGTAATGGAATLEAVKLCDDYKAGDATADGNYKGKPLSLKGTVKNVRDDRASGKKYLELKGSDGGTGTRSVRCYFTEEFQDQIAKMKAGDEVKVQGTCMGKQGTADNFDVRLDQCKLQK